MISANITAISSNLVQRIPEICKIRGVLILATLFLETQTQSSKVTRGNRITDKLEYVGVYKSFQSILCLGSTRFFRSYLISLPATWTIFFCGSFFHSTMAQFSSDIDPKLAEIHSACTYAPAFVDWTLFSLNVTTKVVNSFAIGLLAQRIFTKEQKPGLVMLITTVATLALSIRNIVYDWNRPLRKLWL